MKIKQSSEGGIILHLSQDEIDQIMKLSRTPVLFDEVPTQLNDPYKGLEQKTRHFLDECRNHFHQNEIEWQDEVFNHLRKKHFIIDAGQVFHRLESLGAIEATRVGNRKKIQAFRFLF